MGVACFCICLLRYHVDEFLNNTRWCAVWLAVQLRGLCHRAGTCTPLQGKSVFDRAVWSLCVYSFVSHAQAMRCTKLCDMSRRNPPPI